MHSQSIPINSDADVTDCLASIMRWLPQSWMDCWEEIGGCWAVDMMVLFLVHALSIMILRYKLGMWEEAGKRDLGFL